MLVIRIIFGEESWVEVFFSSDFLAGSCVCWGFSAASGFFTVSSCFLLEASFAGASPFFSSFGGAEFFLSSSLLWVCLGLASPLFWSLGCLLFSGFFSSEKLFSLI